MEEQNEWKFKCPACKSEERLIQLVVDRDKKSGWISEKTILGAISSQEVPITEAGKQHGVGDDLSVLVIFADICAQCGTQYIFRIVRELRKFRMDVSKLIPPQGMRGLPSPNRLPRGN